MFQESVNNHHYLSIMEILMSLLPRTYYFSFDLTCLFRAWAIMDLFKFDSFKVPSNACFFFCYRSQPLICQRFYKISLIRLIDVSPLSFLPSIYLVSDKFSKPSLLIIVPNISTISFWFYPKCHFPFHFSTLLTWSVSIVFSFLL